MKTLNKILKIVLILVAIFFLYVLNTFPKTDCESCQFIYDGEIIDGFQAYDIVQEACISYDSPWDEIPSINETFINK